MNMLKSKERGGREKGIEEAGEWEKYKVREWRNV
jgi:hypothetical protein